ncbi:hypothetical protein ACMBCN_01555, partial [Candidatus Liberibacter asiaticus]|nr:hypothetical protein [Candidatus Liberibacter asiaticus]
GSSKSFCIGLWISICNLIMCSLKFVDVVYKQYLSYTNKSNKEIKIPKNVPHTNQINKINVRTKNKDKNKK